MVYFLCKLGTKNAYLKNNRYIFKTLCTITSYNMTPVSPISHSWDIFFLKTLNLWKLSDGSTNTKTDRKGQERKETSHKTLFDRCHMSCVMCHMLCVTCHMSSVNCHYLPTAIARNPSTANFLTIHSRLVCNDPKATKKRNKSFIN